MAGTQLTVNSHDTDALFTQVIHDAGAGEQILNRYGPHIQNWPSGYRTLGFGAEGTDLEPAAALAFASVGGLAVRAAAGESDAAQVLHENGLKVGLTLQSATAHTAFDSVRRGAGILPALAVATNIADRDSHPSLGDMLLNGSSLGSILGDSASDTGNVKTGSVDALYGTDRMVVDEAEKAVGSYVNRYFGKPIPEQYRILHAYAALARRTNALEDRRSPSAKLWLGTIVQTADFLSQRLPHGKTLEDLLHEDVYELYIKAKEANISTRPRGFNIPGGSGSLPSRERTTIDAAKLGVPRGANSADLAAVRASGQAVAESSFTARRSNRETTNLDRNYLEILTTGITNYKNCREVQERKRLQGEDYRRRVAESLQALFNAYPHLRQSNLVLSWNTDQRVASYQQRDGGAHIAQDIRNAETIQNPNERIAAIAGAVSGASLCGMQSREWQAWYQKLIRDPDIQDAVQQHLLENLNLILQRGPSELDRGTLSQFGLTPGEVSRREPLPNSPLHLLLLAADVVNANPSSAMPIGRSVRLRGKSLAERRAAMSKYADPNRNPYAKETRKEQRLRRREEQAALRQQRVDEAELVGSTLQTYVQSRYNMAVPDDITLGILAECAIAEDMGFFDEQMSDEVRYRLALRMYRAFSRARLGVRSVPVANMPPVVQELYNETMGIMTLHSRTNGVVGNIRNWFKKDYSDSEAGEDDSTEYQE